MTLGELRDFNPHQPRDENGEWSDGMPSLVFDVPIKVKGGNVQVTSGKREQGTASLTAGGRSALFAPADMRELRRVITNAQYDDAKARGSDGVYRLVRHDRTEDGGLKSSYPISLRPTGKLVDEDGKTVATFEDGNGSEVYNAEFDMVLDESPDGDFADEPKTLVSLEDLDTFSPRGMFAAVERGQAARRVDTGNGPTDVFSPKDGTVSFRMKDDAGDPTEIDFKGPRVRELGRALDDVLYGGSDGEPTDGTREHRIVLPDGGAVLVEFKGSYHDGDWDPDSLLTVLPEHDAPWGVAVAGDHIQEFLDAFEQNREATGLGDRSLALQGVEDVAETVDLRSRKDGKTARRNSPATVRARADAPPASAPAGELDVVRDVLRVAELRSDAGKADDVLGTVFGHFSVFDSWYPIRSWWEGDFVERIAPGAFAKTMRERRSSIVTAFDHGFDPQIGDKVLGPIDQLREDRTGAYYEIGLLDTSYNRDLMPGLKRGLYGASFRFAVVKDEWNQEPEASDYNPDKLPERTIRELRLYEFGPVTYPASPAATSAMRSGTDTYYERLARRDPERVGALRSLRNARTLAARPAAGAAQSDSIEPPQRHSAGMSARDRRERLYPTLKGAQS